MQPPRETRSKAQTVVRWATLAAALLLAGVLAWVGRPVSLPARYQELDLPVTGLH